MYLDVFVWLRYRLDTVLQKISMNSSHIALILHALESMHETVFQNTIYLQVNRVPVSF